VRILVAIVLFAIPLMVHAQDAPPPQPKDQTPPPQFNEKVEVVGITPIHGLGLDKHKVAANVQVLSVDQLPSSTLDVATALANQAASVHINEAQAGSFQPDVQFRGFAGSPLLGASEGLAVYQDGVRINEAFGDTINWDTLPTFAIASMNLMPGSNPLFGLNALGGALSIRTKDGFEFPGRRAMATTGSFGRHQIQAGIGGHGQSLAYYVAGALVDESGWRDFSPSATRRLFADLAWRGSASKLNMSVTAASNDLTGNGPAPLQLLERHPRAVFTHPDRTDNDLAHVTIRGQRLVSARTLLDGVAYYRHTRVSTFNGDAADDEEDGQVFDAINNLSATRGRAAGVTAQMTRTTPLWRRENHFIAGAGLDAASSLFAFSTELAELTDDRGTVGSGLFDDDAFVDLRSRAVTASAFVTDTWSPTDALSISASARINWTDVRLRDQIGTALTGDHAFRRINPAAGATYQVRSNVNLYGSYAQSSRVPTPVELTCADPEDPCRLPNAFVSDPPLAQIVARTWEAGARGNVRGVNWSITGFRTAAADDIIFVSSGTLRGEGHFENVKRTWRKGVEASLQYSLAVRLGAFATYTVQQATFGDDLRIASRFHPLAQSAEIVVQSGDRLPGVPTHSAKVGLSAALTTSLNVGINARTQSGQYLRGDEANLLPRVPGFTIVHVRAAQRIRSRVSVVGEAQNIFAADYYTFGVLGDAALLGAEFADDPRFYSPGSPRAAWVGLEVRF
jgi:outer membrane receptor protein involved in Fe transport